MGPAVISTRLPTRIFGAKKFSQCATNSIGSNIRPGPTSPQAF
ncbi:hypothetical protein VCCP104417_0244, partial [Vibrio cholerae CP1044(17)]